jgi:hypothetical protein
MSWTIKRTQQNTMDIDGLRKVLLEAQTKGIILFCSLSDEGAGGNGYPADYDIATRIGAATAAGKEWSWVEGHDAHFLFPGEGVEIDVRTREIASGSSIATALAAGLAALILHCVDIAEPDQRRNLQQQHVMKKAFQSLCKTGNNYLKVWEVFKSFKDKGRVENINEVRKLVGLLVPDPNN